MHRPHYWGCRRDVRSSLSENGQAGDPPRPWKLWLSTPRRLPRSRATRSTRSTSGRLPARAVAFWGGDFWVFLQLPPATSTVVYRVDGKTFMPRTAIADTGRSIVGAGVSTCAPLTLL